MIQSLLTYVLVALMLAPGQSAFTGGRTGAVAKTAGGGGGYTFVNAFEQNQSTNPTNTFNYTCTAGDFLWINADTVGGSATETITVSGNTVVPVTGWTNITTATGSRDITASNAYVTSCSGGAVTITATNSIGAFGQITIQEYSKGSMTGVPDQVTSPVFGNGGGTGVLSCSATSTSAGELMIVNVDQNNSVPSWSPVTGFNLRIGAGGGNSGYDDLATTSGTNTWGTFSPVASNTITFCATFK